MDYSVDTLNAYKVNRPGQTEVIRQRLYDFQVYPTAGSTQFTFFTNPVGQGKTSSSGATAGTPKSYADTNMDISGALPRPKSYLIESVEVIFEPGSSSVADTFTRANPNQFITTAAAALLDQVADVNLIRITGWLELYIGSKTYLTEAPLGTFPPKVHLEMDVAVAQNGTSSQATASESGATNARWGGRPYYMDPPITLESLQNFAVFLKFPVLTATPSGWNGRIGTVFDGVMFRLSQ